MTKGGYDVELVNGELENDVTCSICLFILKDPMQAIECGHRFCKTCVAGLQKGIDGNYICPQDRSETPLYPDKGKGREISNLIVKCSRNKLGCVWIKELRELENHLAQCDFEIVQCVIEACSMTFQRQFENEHYSKECYYRLKMCPFCSEEYILAYEEEHIEDCEQFPLCCDFCNAVEIAKSEMETHLLHDCKKLRHSCPFANLGCEKKMFLEDLKVHEANSHDYHLQLASNKIALQDQVISEQTQNAVTQGLALEMLLERIKKLENKPSVLSDVHVWSIPSFTREIEKAEEHLYLSKLIYTAEGYKMEFLLYPNGDLDKAVSCFCRSVEGPFADLLKWPMKKIIRISILDKNYNLSRAYKFNTENHNSFKEPVHKHQPRGWKRFIPHDQLPILLHNDTLTLKINIIDAV